MPRDFYPRREADIVDFTRNFRDRIDAALPPGTCVWIIACWMNRRGQCGPISKPVYAHTQYAVVLTPQQAQRVAA